MPSLVALRRQIRTCASRLAEASRAGRSADLFPLRPTSPSRYVDQVLRSHSDVFHLGPRTSLLLLAPRLHPSLAVLRALIHTRSSPLIPSQFLTHLRLRSESRTLLRRPGASVHMSCLPERRHVMSHRHYFPHACSVVTRMVDTRRQKTG